GGIANMNRIPGAIFVVDTIKESIAVNEAIKLHLPIIALADTNSDPDIPDHIIPCNDDSARTIQLITSTIADAIIEYNAAREAQKEEELLEQAAENAKQAEQAQQKVQTGGKQRKRRRRKKVAAQEDKSTTKTAAADEE